MQKLKKDINKETGAIADSVPLELLTIKQVALRLGVTTRTVATHKASGLFPYVTFGKTVRFEWEKVYRACSFHESVITYTCRESWHHAA